MELSLNTNPIADIRIMKGATKDKINVLLTFIYQFYLLFNFTMDSVITLIPTAIAPSSGSNLEL